MAKMFSCPLLYFVLRSDSIKYSYIFMIMYAVFLLFRGLTYLNQGFNYRKTIEITTEANNLIFHAKSPSRKCAQFIMSIVYNVQTICE